MCGRTLRRAALSTRRRESRAESRRKQLETFDAMRKAVTGDEAHAVEVATKEVHKYAKNAVRRYRRLLVPAGGEGLRGTPATRGWSAR